MIEYNEEYDAYVIEFEDAVICMEDEPDDSFIQTAEEVRNAYLNNIRHIGQTIYDEVKDIFDVTDENDVISKLGKPAIYPDNGQVSYFSHSFDDMHIISFEYLDDEFDDIQYVTIDG